MADFEYIKSFRFRKIINLKNYRYITIKIFKNIKFLYEKRIKLFD